MSADVLASLPFTLQTVNSTQHQEEEKIWNGVLSEVSSKASNSLQGGSVIILGENQCGKTTLLDKLQKNDLKCNASALEYHILNVQNDFRDSSYAYQLGTAGGLGTLDNLVVPVWTLDGEECFAPLLKYALPSTSPSKAVVLMCASIDNPGLIHSLRRWANLLVEQVNLKYDKATIKEARDFQERYWQEYMEPVECSMTTSMTTGIEETGLLPLEHGVLIENCGASIIVVLTKADLGADLSDQQADRILVQVRRLCLQLGAALVYVSSRQGKNMQLLYKYIVHRSFGVPFTSPAQLIERDSLFVPAGWDGQKKIDIIKDGVPDVDVPLEPTREKPAVVKELLVEAEDEQMFLQRLAAAEAVAPTPVKKAALLEEGTDSSPLASFFSNLLKDKPATPPRTSNQDAAAHLDRILNKKGNQDEDSTA